MTVRPARVRGMRRRRKRKVDPIRPWAKRLKASRPGLVEFVLEGVQSLYGVPAWKRVLDPTSELVLVILTQNTADINADSTNRAPPWLSHR